MQDDVHVCLLAVTEGHMSVVQGLAAIVTASCDALTHLQGQVDEHLRWISGSRTQPDNATAALLEGECPFFALTATALLCTVLNAVIEAFSTKALSAP